MTPPELRIDPFTGLRVLLGNGPLPRDDAAAPAPEDGPMLGRIVNPNIDLFWSAPAVGAVQDLPFAAGTAEADLETWRERMRAHTDAAYVHVGVDPAIGGARLYALPFVPQLVARERERFGAYATRTMGGNLLADLVQEEVKQRERIVAIDDDTVLMAPFGARVPYQLTIAPRRGRPRFEDDGPTGAAMLTDALRRLETLRARQGGTGGVHVWVRTAPQGAEHFCWRIELLPESGLSGAAESGGPAVAAAESRPAAAAEPRPAAAAESRPAVAAAEPRPAAAAADSRPAAGAGGLALATGLQVNPVTPEAAAAALRDL